MESLSSRVERFLRGVVLTLLGVLALLAIAETLLWSLLQISIAELPEIEGILLVWFTLLSAAWAVPRGLHLAVDWLPASSGATTRRALDALAHGGTALFGALLAYYGIALCRAVGNTLPATGLPAKFQYFAAVVAGAAIAVAAIARAVENETPRG